MTFHCGSLQPQPIQQEKYKTLPRADHLCGAAFFIGSAGGTEGRHGDDHYALGFVGFIVPEGDESNEIFESEEGPFR